jgi:hypothetical protein
MGMGRIQLPCCFGANNNFWRGKELYHEAHGDHGEREEFFATYKERRIKKYFPCTQIFFV